jgi:hypothetical protein
VNWWPFRRKPKPLPIPKFRPASEPKVEPKIEPMEVHELQDSMTKTGIHRVWERWKSGDKTS